VLVIPVADRLVYNSSSAAKSSQKSYLSVDIFVQVSGTALGYEKITETIFQQSETRKKTEP
jgi:hypothetical protein